MDTIVEIAIDEEFEKSEDSGHADRHENAARLDQVLTNPVFAGIYNPGSVILMGSNQNNPSSNEPSIRITATGDGNIQRTQARSRARKQAVPYHVSRFTDTITESVDEDKTINDDDDEQLIENDEQDPEQPTPINRAPLPEIEGSELPPVFTTIEKWMQMMTKLSCSGGTFRKKLAYWEVGQDGSATGQVNTSGAPFTHTTGMRMGKKIASYLLNATTPNKSCLIDCEIVSKKRGQLQQTWPAKINLKYSASRRDKDFNLMFSSGFLDALKAKECTWITLKSVIRKPGDKLQIELVNMLKTRPSSHSKGDDDDKVLPALAEESDADDSDGSDSNNDQMIDGSSLTPLFSTDKAFKQLLASRPYARIPNWDIHPNDGSITGELLKNGRFRGNRKRLTSMRFGKAIAMCLINAEMPLKNCSIICEVVYQSVRGGKHVVEPTRIKAYAADPKKTEFQIYWSPDFLAEIKRTKSTWAKLKAVVRKTGDKLQIEVLEMYKSRPSFPTIKEEEQDSETEDATQPVPPSFPARSNDDDLLRRVVKRVKTERSEPLMPTLRWPQQQQQRQQQAAVSSAFSSYLSANFSFSFQDLMALPSMLQWMEANGRLTLFETYMRSGQRNAQQVLDDALGDYMKRNK